MKWLVAIETDNDPIPACRLMNVFRRKSVKIVTLALVAQPAGFSLVAVVDSTEGDVDHVFNFLRGLGGVRHVAYYRQEPSAEPSFVFIDAGADSSAVAQFLRSYPGSKMTFASQGKYLYELPGDSAPRWAALDFRAPEFLPLARVETRKGLPQPEEQLTTDR